MTEALTWDDFSARLAEVLGRLPDGAFVEFHEVRRPMEGYRAWISQEPDRLTVELYGNNGLDPDRQVSVAQQDLLREAGWSPLFDDDLGMPWEMQLGWPATSAEYRGLADSLVAVFRDLYRMAAPGDLAYQAHVVVDDVGEPLPLPELGLETIRVEHYARLGPGDVRERPKGLLRRCRIGSTNVDDALNRDGRWRPTDTLEWADLGEIDDELVPLTPRQAHQATWWWRKLAVQAAEDDKLPPGTPRMRLAESVDQEQDASGTAVLPAVRLHERERSAVAAYLRGGRLVAAAWGYDADPFDPNRAQRVPLNFRTDGEWVWSESLAYFAARYGVPPEPDFLRHMAQRQYHVPDVDEEQMRRAVELIGPA